MGIKPFICPFESCGKGFNEKGNLKTHIRIHTGEKPFVCTHPGCGIAFKALGHLKDHQKRHSNTKPFSCPICKNSFIRKSTLKIHLSTHGAISSDLVKEINKDKMDQSYLNNNININDTPNENINDNLELKSFKSNFNNISKNYSSFFDNDSNLINQLKLKQFSSSSFEMPKKEEIKNNLLSIKTMRTNTKNKNCYRVLSKAKNNINTNININLETKLANGKNEENKSNINLNDLDKKKTVNNNKYVNNLNQQKIINYDVIENEYSLNHENNKIDTKINNKIKAIRKDGVIIPEAKLANQVNLHLNPEDNKKKEKDFENFLKPNSTNLNHCLNNINNPLYLQNSVLNNNINTNYNNILSNNCINNITYLSNNNSSKSKSYLNFSNMQNNFSNPLNANNLSGTNYFTYPATNINNISTMQNSCFLGNNPISNNSTIHNISNNTNIVNNCNLNNIKKETIDFSDLQSIKNLNKNSHYEIETPGTVTEYNLNTISSLHSNLKDLNTLESMKRSNYSLSPFFSQNMHRSFNFPTPDNVNSNFNQNITNVMNNDFENPNLKNVQNLLSSVDSNNFKNMPKTSKPFTAPVFDHSMLTPNNNEINKRALSNLELNQINNNNKHNNISENNEKEEFKNYTLKDTPEQDNNNSSNLPQQTETNEMSKFNYFIKKNSNGSGASNFTYFDNSPLNNINTSANKNYQANKVNDNYCITPSNTNLSNNNKRSNFTLYSKVNNIKNFNSINIKINNINNNATTPSNRNSRMNENFVNLQDFISNLNNQMNKSAGNNSNSTPSSNNSNLKNKKESIIFSHKNSKDFNNDLNEQYKTPLNNSCSNISFNSSNNNIFNNSFKFSGADNFDKESNNKNIFENLKSNYMNYFNNSQNFKNLNNSNISNYNGNQQEILQDNASKENFQTVENCIISYINMYFQTRDKNMKFSGQFEVLNLFQNDSLQNFIEKMIFYIRENPIIFKNTCERYKYLYLDDSDPEIKFVILKKILNDMEKFQAHSLKNLNWNLLSNINSGSNRSQNSSGNYENFDNNKQEILKFGFKDIAEKYYSNIYKTIPNFIEDYNFKNINLNVNNNSIGNLNEFITPRGNIIFK